MCDYVAQQTPVSLSKRVWNLECRTCFYIISDLRTDRLQSEDLIAGDFFAGRLAIHNAFGAILSSQDAHLGR